MNRRSLALLTLVPLALLPAGCATAPRTAREREAPEATSAAAPGFDEVIAAWRLPPTDPWSIFSKPTLLAALRAPPAVALPDVRRLPGLPRAECAASRVAEAGLPPGMMWIVDLRGAESVAFGAALSQLAREPVSLVLTFNNRPAPRGLVPAEETLAELISVRPRLPSGREPSTPVFLLDTWRLAYRDVRMDPSLTDNRYALSSADFPDVGLLKGRGIRRVVYLMDERAHPPLEASDLDAMLLEYAGEGIPISVVDLGWLCGLQEERPWDLALRATERTERPGG